MVDTPVLGTGAFGRGGSSPLLGTINVYAHSTKHGGMSKTIFSLILCSLFILAGCGIDVNQKNDSSIAIGSKAEPVMIEEAIADQIDSGLLVTGTMDDAQEFGENSIDTTNWKTYRNEEYGFELKYPRGWEVRDNIELYGNVSFRDGIRFLDMDSGYVESSSVWVEIGDTGGVGMHGFDVFVEDVQVDGEYAEKVSFIGSADSLDSGLSAEGKAFQEKYTAVIVTFLNSNKNPQDLRIHFDGDKDKVHFLDKFLSSFHFID